MAIQTERAQIDGSINIDGSIFQYGEEFTGGGDVSLGALTDVSIGGFIGDGYILEYETTGDYWTQGAIPARFRNLGMMDPIHFPFIEGEFSVDVSILTDDVSTSVRVDIIPDDVSYNLIYGYSGGVYRIRNQTSTITSIQKIWATDPSRYEVFTIYADYPSGDGQSLSAGQPTSDLGSTSCILATLQLTPSRNPYEVIKTVNWSKLELNATAGGGGGGDVAWANGNVGSNNQILTAAGDGSIWAESGITYDFVTKLFTVDSSITTTGQTGGDSLGIIAGPHTTGGTGGALYLYGGIGSGTTGGNVDIKGGLGQSQGGHVSITGGVPNPDGTGGDVSINAGPGGSGSDGKIYIGLTNTLGIDTGPLGVTGDVSTSGNVFAGNTKIADTNIELSAYGTGNRYAYIDFHGDDTYTDYGLRIIRSNGGENTISELIHRGTGDFRITATDGGLVKITADVSINGKTNSADGFETGNFEIVHNTTSDSLDFNYIA